MGDFWGWIPHPRIERTGFDVGRLMSRQDENGGFWRRYRVMGADFGENGLVSNELVDVDVLNKTSTPCYVALRYAWQCAQ